MEDLLHLVSQAAKQNIEWSGIENALSSFVIPMSRMEQNSEFHAEGDVWTHTKMVCETLVKLNSFRDLSETRQQAVFLAALLHDCDDYKLFGNECAEKLINSRRIMTDAKIGKKIQQKVCDIISTIGYSKRMTGVVPQTLEGKIVSDADMLEAMGAVGIIRCLTFALARCNKYGTPLFDENVWPVVNMSAEEYKKKDRRSDNFINHFFEKMFKLYELLLTPAGKKEGARRHEFMIIFLEQFFEEQGCANWKAYLKNYIRRQRTSISTKATLKRLRDAGKKLGRPVGSKKPNKLIKREAKIKEMLKNKEPKSNIAKKLKCSRSTLYRYLNTCIKKK